MSKPNYEKLTEEQATLIGDVLIDLQDAAEPMDEIILQAALDSGILWQCPACYAYNAARDRWCSCGCSKGMLPPE